MSNEPKWTPADIQWEAAGQSRPGGPVCPVTIQMVIAAKDDPKASQRLYDALIIHYRAYPIDPEKYFETHHIIPRCLKGSNKPSNLIRIPAAAHFDAHVLLVQIHVGHHNLSGLKVAVRLLFGGHEDYDRIIGSPAEMRLRYERMGEIIHAAFLENKAKFIAMIKAGAPRPNGKRGNKEQRYLGNMLQSYLTETSRSFRPGLKEELIAAGGAYWFPDYDAIFENNKRQYLELIRAGKPRPNSDSDDRTERYLAQILTAYTKKSAVNYRPGLVDELVAAGGGYWFRDYRYEANRAKFLALIKAGEPRPFWGSYLGRILFQYLHEGASGHRPGLKEDLIAAGGGYWFPDFDDAFQKNKATFLVMIKAGRPRPNKRSLDKTEKHLGIQLLHYVQNKYNNPLYAELRNELIAAGGAYWFPDFDAIYKKNKAEYLTLIKGGKPRPSMKTYLGRILAQYIGNTTRNFRPGLKEELIAAGGAYWFNASKYEDNKRELLLLARAGADRPKAGTPLGISLTNYISASGRGFRPGLKEELIKAGAGHWFKAA